MMDNANTVKYPGHTLLNLRGNYKFSKKPFGMMPLSSMGGRGAVHMQQLGTR